MTNNHQIIATVALAGVLLLGGCQSNTSSSNANANAASNSNSAASNSAANTAAAPQLTAAGSPSAAYEAAYAARKNKDTAALKELLSKDVLEFLAMIGQADPKKKQTLDELLLEMCERPQADRPDTRNEKVEGDKATIEYLDETGNWQSMAFIKEDGAWKLTIDGPEPGPAASNSNSNTNTK